MHQLRDFSGISSYGTKKLLDLCMISGYLNQNNHLSTNLTNIFNSSPSKKTVQCLSLHVHRLQFFKTSGPLLPLTLDRHSMVRLGKGQAILGGRSNGILQAKIYSMTCSNKNCVISLLDRELSAPRYQFVAIPIPDTISGCITGGKKTQINPKALCKPNFYFTPRLQTASSQH